MPKPQPEPAPAAAPATKVEAAAAAEEKVEPEPLRGAAARIVTNMAASLEVPTATSFREVPAKLLEVNRKVINGYLGRTRGGKVSFTHLIGYAVVRAIADHLPVMNGTFSVDADGKPQVTRNAHVNLGLAVDQQKSDGSRTLLVPGHQGRRHPGLPWVLGRLRGRHPQGQVQQAQRPTTSPAPPSRSPTPAPSAPSSRCRA